MQLTPCAAERNEEKDPTPLKQKDPSPNLSSGTGRETSSGGSGLKNGGSTPSVPDLERAPKVTWLSSVFWDLEATQSEFQQPPKALCDFRAGLWDPQRPTTQPHCRKLPLGLSIPNVRQLLKHHEMGIKAPLDAYPDILLSLKEQNYYGLQSIPPKI